jgi:hypothetical protein
MPLTTKGRHILSKMEKTYGPKKAEQVLYASKNAGRIRGIDANCPQHSYMDACRKGDTIRMQADCDRMLRARRIS